MLTSEKLCCIVDIAVCWIVARAGPRGPRHAQTQDRSKAWVDLVQVCELAGSAGVLTCEASILFFLLPVLPANKKKFGS